MFFAGRLCARGWVVPAAVFLAAVFAGCEVDRTGVELTVEFPRTIDEVFITGEFDDGLEAFMPKTFHLDPPAGEKGSGTIIILLPEARHGSQITLRLTGGTVMKTVAVVIVAKAIVGASTSLVEVIDPPDPPEEVCGNGEILDGEICDDGGIEDGDGCSSGCMVEDGWTCTSTPSVCRSCPGGPGMCAVCGDGALHDEETCDDMNLAGGDGCSALCRIEPGFTCSEELPSSCEAVCGDGFVLGGEDCDDMNLDGGDGCDALCELEDGFMCSQESPSMCAAICGDGVLLGAEACDDENVLPGDGCSAVCAIEAGWNCLPNVVPSRCFSPDTIFVDAGAPCPEGDGGFEHPFCTITEAIAVADGDVVAVLPGAYEEKLTIDNTNMMLIAVESATIAWSAKDALKIRGSSVVTVRGFSITGVGGAGGGVKVEGSSTAHLEDCSIGPSSEIGIESTGSSALHLRRSFVHDNAKGGLKLDSSNSFELFNNVIARNSIIGGIYVVRSTLTSKLINNTIADNIGGMEMMTVFAGGVHCEGALGAVTVLNSILWNNMGGAPAGVTATCTVRRSVITTAPALNFDNRFLDPQLDAITYRLTAGSPAIDFGDPAGVQRSGGPAPDEDIDNEPRPLGAGVDVGADESF